MAAELASIAENVFLGNAHTRMPFPGVAAFYRALEQGQRIAENPDIPAAARKTIVARLEDFGFLEKVEANTHMVPHGDRSGVVIEPYLTDQWYVDAKTLAAPAIVDPMVPPSR